MHGNRTLDKFVMYSYAITKSYGIRTHFKNRTEIVRLTKFVLKSCALKNRSEIVSVTNSIWNHSQYLNRAEMVRETKSNEKRTQYKIVPKLYAWQNRFYIVRIKKSYGRRTHKKNRTDIVFVKISNGNLTH